MRKRLAWLWKWVTTVDSGISIAERLVWLGVVTGVPSFALGWIMDDPWRFVVVAVLGSWLVLAVAVLVARSRGRSRQQADEGPLRVKDYPISMADEAARDSAKRAVESSLQERMDEFGQIPALAGVPLDVAARELVTLCARRAALIERADDLVRRLWEVDSTAPRNAYAPIERDMTPWFGDVDEYAHHWWRTSSSEVARLGRDLNTEADASLPPELRQRLIRQVLDRRAWLVVNGADECS